MRIREYVKDHMKWIVVIIFVIMLTTGILILNDISMHEIYYAIGINLFVTALVLASDWNRYRQKFDLLQRLSDREHQVINISNVEQAINEMTKVSELEREYDIVLKAILSQQVEMQNRQEDRQRQMQDYYGMWVHQIKTPISALRLLLQQKDMDSNEEQTELFRIEQYVDMALQYIRIDATDHDFVIEEISLEKVLRSSVRKFARQFVTKKISLDFKPTQAKVITDAKWIGFVVDQILSNAIKYTSKGKVAIYVEQTKETTSIVIEDTGIGIRAEDLPRICEKGYTGYNGRANQHATGIGLYLCNQIINKLGHRMNITSEQGKGTKVEIVVDHNLT